MLRYTYITSHVTNEAWSFPSLSERHILTKNCSYIRITWVRSRSKSNGISSCLIHPMSLILAHQFDNISVQLRIFIHKCDNSQKYSEPITGVFRVHIHLFFPPYILLCDTKFYSALRIIRPHFTAENFNSLSSYKNSKHETNFWKWLIHLLAYNLFNPLKPELNSICYLLTLLEAHHFLHVSRIRVKLLTFRLLMSYIYGAPILDVSRSHTTTQHSR